MIRGCVELDLSAEVDALGELSTGWSIPRPRVDGIAVRVYLGDAGHVTPEAASRLASATYGATLVDVVGRHREAVDEVLFAVRSYRAREAS